MKRLSQHLASSSSTRKQSSARPIGSQVTTDVQLPGQVRAHDGKFVFPVTPWQQALRFLILGSEGGSYYASERKLTLENAQSLLHCLSEDADRLIDLIVDVSLKNRAASNDPALFALALVTTYGEPDAKAMAYAALPRVARIGTHLFHFVSYANDLRGWGRGLRRAVAEWYTERRAKSLAEQLTKYQSRDGFSHRDVLRLSHAKPKNPSQAHMFKLAVGKVGRDEDVPAWVRKGHPSPRSRAKIDQETVEAWQYLGAVRSMSADIPVAAAVSLIRTYNLPREVVPTNLLTELPVWEALFPHMGYTALIRNLGTMTRIGLLTPKSEYTREVMERLSDQDGITRARVHPMAILMALTTYARGQGEKSDKSWTPVKGIIAALDQAFYLSFGNVEPSGKRHMLAVDVSGSMDGGGYGGYGSFQDIRPGLSPRLAAAAMALITAKTEPWTHMVGFSHHLEPLPISPAMTLDQAIEAMRRIPMGATDCALPMLHAIQQKLSVDTFVVYTDSETNVRQVHPSKALQAYRRAFNRDARLIVCGMVANNFTLADPNDAGMLDVVGFDTATPAIMAEFSRGEL